MVLEVPLSPELETRISRQASELGIAPSEYAMRLLNEHTPDVDRRAQAIALLQSWIDTDDPDEQKETGDFLIKALDEDRLSNRPLFPPEKKGITW